MPLNEDNSTESKKTERQLRFYKQKEKADSLLNVSRLYDYIDGLKYSYSLCIRYNINLKKTIDKNINEVAMTNALNKDWNDTYWFDKEMAEDLQQFILEHQ